MVHRALEGSRVDVSTLLAGSDLSLGQDGTTSFVSFDVGSPRGAIRRRFSAGSAEFHAFRAETIGVTLTERYTLPSGRLRVGSAVHYDEQVGVSAPLHFGVWEDRVSTAIYNGRKGDLIDLFGRFAFHDTPEGAWMQALPASAAMLVRGPSNPPTIAKPIPGVGLLQVVPMRPDFATPPAARIRTESEFGEKVYVEHGGTGDVRVLLVGPSAVAWLLPHEGVDEVQAVTAATSLKLTWAG